MSAPATAPQIEALKAALAPFVFDWDAAGVPDNIDGARAMTDVDSGSELTVGQWRALIEAARPILSGNLGKQCPASRDGRHHVDTSMESGPNNCFHCEADMSASGGQA